MSKQIEASSELNVDQCTFTWTISDYSSIVKVPGGYDESCKEFISLFLSRIKHDEMKEVSECKLTISILTPVCGLSEIETTEPDTILQLRAVAGKYQINNLKIKCGKILCANLSKKNAIDFLVASYKYNVKYLKDEVINYVIADISLFINAEELKNIDDSIIFINLIQSMIKSK
uniref:BTB domain-containing protein n=1 Tax=Trichogramma kaykai TaxID=54128 RepID=A0ABD2X572_9HYME